MNIAQIMNTPLHFKVRGNMRNLHPTTMPLWSLVKGIQESKALADLTAQGRAIQQEKGAEAFKEWKPKNLMSVYFAVRYKDSEGRADADNVGGYTGLAGFDFDDVDARAMLEALRGVPQVVCAGVSASGKGVWCAAAVEAATAQEYARCFADGIRAFRDAGISGMDIGAHDPTRARFAASCPECWWRYDADEGDVPAFKPVGDISLLGNPKKSTAKKTKLPTGYHIQPELAYDRAREILAEAREVEVGNRDNTMAQECGRLKALAKAAGVSPSVYAQEFIATWDAKGYPHKKTVSMATRLLMGKD